MIAVSHYPMYNALKCSALMTRAPSALTARCSEGGRFFGIHTHNPSMVNSSTKCNAVKKHGRRNKGKGAWDETDWRTDEQKSMVGAL